MGISVRVLCHWVFLINTLLNIGSTTVCTGSTHKIKPCRKPNQDVCKSTSTEKYEKKPMKRKRRHTTDMEDLLAEDEDRLVTGTINGLNSVPDSYISSKGHNSIENQSEILSRQFSKLGLKEKYRKSKRHCTRCVLDICVNLQQINFFYV